MKPEDFIKAYENALRTQDWKNIEPLVSESVSVIFSNDKCTSLDKYNEGDHVEVQYNLRGREWTNPQGEVKVFNTEWI